VPQQFVLYGGTALALHLGHRESVDFDFFADRSIDVPTLEAEVPFLAASKITQRDKNPLSALVDRGGPVKVFFFAVPRLGRLTQPYVSEDNGLKIAALLDLAGTKVSVVQVRAEAKDYLDIHALMNIGKVSLSTALVAAQRLYGSSFNPEITLKALSYFDDGNLRDLPDGLKRDLASAARAVDLDHLPSIDRCIEGKGVDMSSGYEL
jgi:hypothetical protein